MGQQGVRQGARDQDARVDQGAEAGQWSALGPRRHGAGEWSSFEEQHRFSIDGVDLETAVLPAGWRGRLVRVQNANTAAPSGRPQFIGWCLGPEDLCVAKLCAHREKDLNFVRALHDAGLVNAAVIADRLLQVETRHQEAAAVARRWMASLAT